MSRPRREPRQTARTRALPKRFRLARNLDEGWQVHAECPEHSEDGHWLTITSALHILSPIKASTFNLDAPDCIADARRCTVRPDDSLLSRRPAGDR